MSSTKHFVRRAGLALMALACAAPMAVLAQNPQPQPQPQQQPQQPAAQTAPVDADADKLPGAKNQRIERIHVEDNNATVDELRVGGQTQSITVKPNSRAPAYQVMPNASELTRGQGQADSAARDTSRVWWNALKF
jgi:hypothetical protein